MDKSLGKWSFMETSSYKPNEIWAETSAYLDDEPKFDSILLKAMAPTITQQQELDMNRKLSKPLVPDVVEKWANTPTRADHNLELYDSHLIPVSPSTNVIVLSRKELFEFSDSLLDTGFKDMGLEEVGPAVNEVLDSKDAVTKYSKMANLNSFQREELCKSPLGIFAYIENFIRYNLRQTRMATISNTVLLSSFMAAFNDIKIKMLNIESTRQKIDSDLIKQAKLLAKEINNLRTSID